MRPDHYAALGVDPNASAAEIRAAYLKLMREHHPDRNRSPEAGGRAQGIIAAFKVLSDFDQRSFYDWDRRRDREALEAEAAAPDPRRVRRVALTAAGMAVAAAGAWTLVPNRARERPPPAPTTLATAESVAEVDARPALARRPAAARIAPRERGAGTLIRVRPALPKAFAAKGAAISAQPSDLAVAPKPMTRLASGRPSPGGVTPTPRSTSRPQAVKEAGPPLFVARPAESSAKSAPTSTQTRRGDTELASLDQFVMSFYGQSWRYGDAPKRAVLEQTRASFVARRGACLADPCKRAAYLKLMRDVSEIVEMGQPRAR